MHSLTLGFETKKKVTLENQIFSSYQLQRAEKEMNELRSTGVLQVSLEFGLQGAE